MNSFQIEIMELEWIHSNLEPIHSVLEYIHSCSTFLIVCLQDVSWPGDEHWYSCEQDRWLLCISCPHLASASSAPPVSPAPAHAELVELSTTILSTIGILLTWAMKIANIGEVSPYTVLTEVPVMWRYLQARHAFETQYAILGLKMLFGK